MDRAIIGALLLIPVLVKLPLVLGFLHADPMLLFSGLALAPGGGITALPTLDPNVGYTSQALGYRAALDVFSGRMPWWNPFEGLGAPLAGELQSAALFPLTWLLLLPNGQLLEHLVLQQIAGASCFFLLRTLRIGRPASGFGAAMFMFNGVFAWLGNAIINPVPFLPVLLLGVECTAMSVRTRRMGSTWIVAGIAASLYAGFPEVAYLDGLLALVWTLMRAGLLPKVDRVAFLREVALAGTAALFLAAPILIAFLDYVPFADLGLHGSGGLDYASLDGDHAAGLALPYLFGSIFSNPAYSAFWSMIGGYSGCCLPGLALAGVFGKSRRALRLTVAGWVVLSLGATFGATGLQWLLYLVPGLREIALYRYLFSSWLFCLCILAAFAIDDLLRHGRRAPVAFGLACVAVALAAALVFRDNTHLPIMATEIARGTAILAAACALVASGFLFIGKVHRQVAAAGVAAATLVEAIVLFAIPVLHYPRSGAIDIAGVDYLRSHLGMQRFATLGPIAPNYGSYFGIAAVNHNDLPIPAKWTGFLGDNLDRNAVPTIFNGIDRADPHGISSGESLLANIATYAGIGVRYVVTTPDRPLPGLPEVFRGLSERIFELDGVAPYFRAPGCRIEALDRTHVRTICPAPSILVRLELSMPGWRVDIDGQSHEVHTFADIFQSVQLPAGPADVRFDFQPPFILWGYAMASFAAGALIVDTVVRTRPATPDPDATPTI